MTHAEPPPLDEDRLLRGDVLLAKYSQRADGEWLGCVFRHRARSPIVCVSVGCERSVYEIEAWLRNSIALMERHRRTDVEVPDMYERRS